MKQLFALLVLILFPFVSSAQNETSTKLKTIYINPNVSTHFIPMDKILYVDLSTNDVTGDMPAKNILRIKPLSLEAKPTVLTITTEKYIVQYLLLLSDDPSKVCTRYTIPYDDIQNYLNPETGLTRNQLYDYANRMYISKRKYFNVSNRDNLLRIDLNNIYTINRYFFIDLSVLNKTNIQYDINDIRFKIEDKKQTKATNFQSIEIKPLLSIDPRMSFKKKYRNVFVFDKFTFPNDKVFVVEISEKQISGRVIRLNIEYSDVLHADTFVDR